MSIPSAENPAHSSGFERLRGLVVGTLLAFCAVLAGCASAPLQLYPHEKTVTQAWPTPESTQLGKRYAKAPREGTSGVLLLDKGDVAFDARIALADTAERTLDVQYYLWYGDTTGKLMLSRLLAAAQRGVRVRLLIDDINLNGLDFSLALLDSHANFEVRIFNPFAARSSPLGRFVEFMSGARHLNHRMHNKTFIADNAAAIVGGRNIGDHYFNVNTMANFRDLDVLAVGRVAREVSASFDAYWNSEWAIPVKALVKDAPPEARVNRARDALEGFADKLEGYPYPHRRDLQAANASLGAIDNRLTWARVAVLADDPEKISNPDIQRVATALARAIQATQSELLIESAYFVPLDAGVANLSELIRRGVRVRMLTNSLASTDVMLAHVGYSKYRRQMVENGVEVYEFRPDGRYIARDGGFYGSSRVSLHSKALVIDRRIVLVGTPNLDPRSLKLNTEIVLQIESEEFADHVARFIETGLDPQSSWHVTRPKPSEKEPLVEEVDLLWTSERKGRSRFHYEPDVGVLRGMGASMLSILPLDDQL